ncbi:RNA polymerase sigma factor [Streptomyces sp. DSM 15324]|uniref:RNA polymerase sigma factor n=1 Tax=Streptomyces sp. DSM 15324 TaxID=1739111 RepID=UPI0007474A48|nr:sigma-70 family RNA polymerase sigma factor [Streptomyces sp. DSM 15324]KUO11614.1 hypothetical protein AQJ58_10580 [Streptomyces sp. DSM 15324]
MTTCTEPEDPDDDRVHDTRDHPLPDNQWVRAIAEGDEEALSALMSRRSGLVFAHLLQHGLPADVAEEAVQDTFLSVWKSASRFHDGNALRWLLRIARCRAVDLSRSRERSWGRAEQSARAGFDPAGAVAPAPDEHLLASIPDDAALSRAFGRLTTHQREILTLRHIDGLTVEETARHLGLSRSTVTSCTARARARLRALLREEREREERERQERGGEE